MFPKKPLFYAFGSHPCPEHGSHRQHHFAPISTITVCASIPLQPSPIIHHVSQSAPASKRWQPPPAPLCTYFSHTCVRFHSPATLSHHSSCLPFQPHLCPEHGSHRQHHFAPISATHVCVSIPLQPSPMIHHVFHSNHVCVQNMAATPSTTLHLFQPHLCALPFPCNPLQSSITSSIPTTPASKRWPSPPAPLCTYFNHTCMRFHPPATLSHHLSRLPIHTCVQKMAVTTSTT